MKKKTKKRVRLNIKNKKAFLAFIRAARVLLAAAVVVAMGLLSLRLLGKTAMSNVTDALRGVKYYFSESTGYPYKMETLNCRYVDALDNEIIILYNDHSQTLNSLATPMFSRRTGSADTKVKTCNGRALIIDATNNTLTLQSKTELLGSITLENEIMTASLGANGSIAVATKSEGVQSNVSVYNSRMEPVFSWNCSSERITDLSLSRTGKTVAIVAVGAENANLYSRLIIFDIDSVTPLGETRLESTMLLRVIYTAFGKVIAVGDNKAVLYDNTCVQEGEFTYTEDTLSHVVCDDRGNTAICVSEFGGSQTNLISVSSNGKTNYNIVVEGKPASVSVKGGKTALLFGMRADVYGRKGEILKSVELNDFADKIMLFGSGFYTVESGEIQKY